ncbi:DDE-type integrase/transposase/recombinase [Lactococcus lactis subsp. lactis]
MIHSDKGFQYTTLIYQDTLKSLGVTVSHSPRGNCYYNAYCENFFSQLKSEQLYLSPYNQSKNLSLKWMIIFIGPIHYLVK